MYDQITKNSSASTFNHNVVELTQMPECEIRIMLNQQIGAVEIMEKSLANIFQRLGSVLSEAIPQVNEGGDKQATLTPMGKELANTNQRLWKIQDGLNELMNRIQL